MASDNVFGLTQLGIDSPQWQVATVTEYCAYEFSVPFDGVLFLKTAGKITPKELDAQISFINNYNIKVHEKIAHFRIVLVWDISELCGIKSVQLIKKKLFTIQSDHILFTTQSTLVRYVINGNLSRMSTTRFGIFQNQHEAINFAKSIINIHDKEEKHNGRFFDLWAGRFKTLMVNGRKYRVVELSEWKYVPNENLSVTAKMVEGGILHLHAVGAIESADIQGIQQLILKVGNDLEIDLLKHPFYLIFDVTKIVKFSRQARQLVGIVHVNNREVVKSIFVVAKAMLRFVFLLQKSDNDELYQKWHLAKSVRNAFATIERLKSGETLPTKKTTQSKIPSDYHSLKEAFLRTRKTLDVLKMQTEHTNQEIRKILSVVNTGDFFRTPMRPDFRRQGIVAELINSFVLLRNDYVPRFESYVSDSVKSEFAQSNIRKLINNIPVPVFVYYQKQIMFVNSSFEKLLERDAKTIERQNIGVVFNAYEVVRIERYLNEFDSHQKFQCELIDFSGNAIHVALSTELILIDGSNAKMVFILVDGKNSLPHGFIEESSSFKPVVDYYGVINKGIATLFWFHNIVVESCERDASGSHHSAKHSINGKPFETLFHSALFFRKSMEQVADVQNRASARFYMYPEFFLHHLQSVFTNYLQIRHKHKVEVLIFDDIVARKCVLPLHEFFLRAFFVWFFVRFTEENPLDTVTIGVEKFDHRQVMFFIRQLNAKVRFYADADTSANLDVLNMEDMEQMLKMSGSKLFVSEEQGNSKVSFQIPVSYYSLNKSGTSLNLSQYTILVIVESDFEIISKTLEKTQAKLIHAAYAFDVLHADYNNISLVLIDLHLEQTDVFELIKRIKNINHQVPIIGLASFIGHQQWKKSQVSLADAIIAKPIDMVEVQEVLVKHLS